MAMFRSAQIDEILNYDRSMNRTILDRTIAQVSRFNDERNPPSNRDIKFEAIIGSLVDKLKEKIAKALQGIANEQYTTLDEQKVARLMRNRSGENGFAAAIKVPANKALAESLKENEKLLEAIKRTGERPPEEAKTVADNSGLAILQTGDVPGIAPEVAVIEAENELVSPEVFDVQNELINAQSEKLLKLMSKPKPKPKLKAAGKPRRCGGADEPEAAPQAAPAGPAPPNGTVQGAQATTSLARGLETTESLIFAIIAEYNGIIDKIIQSLIPEGRYRTDRSGASSNSGYLASVLKGLLEPLKHLVFELAQVHKPELASMLNMMTSLIDIIDQAPPFQKLDSKAFKNGKPDLQAFSNDLFIDDIPEYITVLEKYRKKLYESLVKYDSHIASTLFNIPKNIRESVKARLTEETSNANDAIEDVEKEIADMTARLNKGFTEASINDPVLAFAKDVIDSMNVLLLPTSTQSGRNYNPKEKSTISDILKDNMNEIRKEEAILQDLGKQYMTLFKIPQEQKRIGDDKKMEKLKVDIQSKQKRVGDLHEQNIFIQKRNKNKGMTGEGKPLADLLANPKQQHTRMGRPVSDDQKIQREMIAKNEKWQELSNPIHTTPVGSLVPFYSKDDASKYLYPQRLRNELNRSNPVQNAYGANISLLQGGPPEEYNERPKRQARRKKVDGDEATKEFIKASEGDDIRQLRGNIRSTLLKNIEGGCDSCGHGEGGSKAVSASERSGALKKLVFNDETNEMFHEEPEETGEDGMIHPEEEKDKKEDRFRNKKLGAPKKRKGKSV